MALSRDELIVFNKFLSKLTTKDIHKIMTKDYTKDDAMYIFKIVFRVYHDLEKTINLME